MSESQADAKGWLTGLLREVQTMSKDKRHGPFAITVAAAFLIGVVGASSGDPKTTATVAGAMGLLVVAMWTSISVNRFKDGRKLLRLEHDGVEPPTVGVMFLLSEGTADEAMPYTGWLAHELKERIDDVPDVELVTGYRIVKPDTDRDLFLRERALEWKANYVVTGEYQELEGMRSAYGEVVQTWDSTVVFSFRVKADGFQELSGRFAGELVSRLKNHIPGAGAPLTPSQRAVVEEPRSNSDAATREFASGKWHSDGYNNDRDVADFELAEEHLKRAVAKDPDYLDARAELGFLYLLRWETDRAGDWKGRSTREFEEIVARDPDHPMALAELGYYACVDGDMARALSMVDRAAKQHPGTMLAQNVRALVHLCAGFYESAVDATERNVLKLTGAGSYVYPRTNAATACLLMEKPDDALEWVERARKIDKNALIVALLEGAARFHKGEYKAAESAWRRGRKQAPGELKSLFDVVLAWVTAARGNKEAACQVLRENLDAGWVGSVYDPYLASLAALSGAKAEAVSLLRKETTWGASYRYLVADPTLRSLRGDEGFQALLGERYETWKRIESRAAQLSAQPPELPPPHKLLPTAG